MADDVAEIKARADLVQIIGESVSLKKAGLNFKGLCPFHGEKTPSFMVSPERGSWHCFGCNEGGDVFSFVMKRDHLDFPEALGSLAKRTGVELKGFNPQDSQKKRRLFEANVRAANYFLAALGHTAGQTARDYLKKRGISKATAKEFQIGYAPDSFEAFVKAMKGKGYTDQELVDAGLAGRSRSTYARFRHRLMIPITDASGIIRGFTGRLLSDAKEAKYVNTSETDLFHKGRLVYALDKAKQAIIDADATVLVEGQMDVITAHQAGTKNVVATSGTAMTEEQLRQITRFSQTIILALDNDAAGRTAMMRIVELVGDRDVELKVADLGDAKDPDELIRQGAETWQKTLDQALPVIDFLMARSLSEHQPPYDRAAIKTVLDAVLPALRYRSVLDHDYYADQLATALGTSKDSVKSRLKPPAPLPVAGPGPTLRHKSPEELVTERLIGLALTTETLQSKLAAVDTRLFPELYRPAAAAAQQLDAPPEKTYTERTDGDSDRALLGVCALAAAEYDPMTETERAAEFDRLLARLKLLWGKQHQPKLLAAIKRAEERGDTPERNRLMEEYTSLTKRIQYAQSH